MSLLTENTKSASLTFATASILFLPGTWWLLKLPFTETWMPGRWVYFGLAIVGLIAQILCIIHPFKYWSQLED